MKRTRQFILFIVLVITFYFFAISSVSSSVKVISFLVYLVTLFSISYVLMLENRSSYRTLLWIYVLFFFPIVGYIFFIFSGQLEVRGHLFRSKREHATEMMKKKLSFKSSSHWNDLTETQQSLSRLIEKFSNNQISFHTSSNILKNGNETFHSIKDAIGKAENYIHLEYYTFRSDQTGQEIIDLLCEKAKDGVEIRLIFDAMGSISLSMKAKYQMKKAGIEVRSFLPVKNGFYNQKLNFRNHRKIIIVDGEVGFVGGLNVGDEYLGRSPQFEFWRDTHLIIKGEVIKTLQDIFVVDWAFVSGETLLDQKYFDTSFVEGNLGGIQILPSGPDSPIDGIMGDLYYELLTSSKKSILIATPYFIPNKAIRTALSMAGSKGIDIKILVPEKSDGFLTKYATSSYFSEMLDYDIEVYMYKKGFLHEKVIIIDEQFASVGTANFDLRSLHLNFEVNAFLFETESVTDLVDHYKEDLLDSSRLDSSYYKERGLALRTKESFARLFSPIL
ncbi:cardiolipin synthase [Alkalihalobacillus deserti]|uniref:cardiolipin synthase n=1 Tax=Alkalihalobacillus deserti TaxID=2879466 RepID=UPI001D152C73|nr:cardiolipin synthase [Alkalihalobacillus deserti]